MDRLDFDYVIVGAGIAGCVLAYRLAADGKHKVCLLEAGPTDRNIYLHIPGGFIKAVTDPRYTWQFKTEPSQGSGGRRIAVPQGRTLGGSSAINGLNYNRGQPADFDGWAQRGCRGWGHADVLPYFMRTERRMGPADPSVRGRTGRLPITDTDWHHPLCDAFIATAAGFGMPSGVDYNGGQQRGAGYFQRWIHRGWRVSAAKAFLSARDRPANLTVLVDAQALSIRLEGRRARSVVYASGPGAPTREVRATREIILCAGAANTPKLLQLSGIGPAPLLGDLGIPVLHARQGVGENLQDHYLVRLVARVKSLRTVNGSSRGLPLMLEILKWSLGRPSILAISPSVAFGFVHSTDATRDPDLQLNFTPGSYKASVSGALDSFDGATLGAYQLRPESRGYVRARASDPFTDPLIQPNYLSDPLDRRTAIDGIRLVRRIFEADPLRRYIDRMDSPDPSAVTDDELLDFARQKGNTAYHLMGTCRMGTRDDPSSVVDDRLRVIGLEGLRVADASIMPTMPSANTAAAVYMIAEKAADLVLGREPPAPIIKTEPLLTAEAASP